LLDKNIYYGYIASMKAKARGRPFKAERDRKSVMFRIMVTPAERDAIERNAEEEKLPASTWARKTILEAINIDPK
jgi:hypothetical protein